MFRKLCGDDALGNVILATTMWEGVDQAIGLDREKKLKDEFWNIMLELGSRVERFTGEGESAWAIIDVVAQKRQMEILKRLAEFNRFQQQLSNSQAMIIDLCEHLRKSLAQHKETLQSLQESATSNGDEQLKKMLVEESNMLQLRLQHTFDQVITPKAPFRRRFFQLFRRKSLNVRRTSNIPSRSPTDESGRTSERI
jgi:hypothetical protein